MTLTIKQMKELLDPYPDCYHISGLCVQVYNSQYQQVKELHELEIPYTDIDIGE